MSLKRRILYCLFGVFCLLLWCEFLIYYVVLLHCHWPDLSGSNADPYVRIGPPNLNNLNNNNNMPNIHVNNNNNKQQNDKQPTNDKQKEEFVGWRPLRVMLVADTHLLGIRFGHWFDRLRREWQMERSFQTAMFIHSPDVVFFLGDVFDEGKWASNEELDLYVQRFDKMFRHWNERTQVKIVIGNHDVGFHYDMTRHKLQRMQQKLNATPSVYLWSPHNSGVHFVLLNSMAMEGDECNLCRVSKKRLERISQQFACLRGDDLSQMSNCADADILTDSAGELATYSRPIILQHFPLYRMDDSHCPKEVDSMPQPDRSKANRERWETLSRSSSEWLLENLKPRLVFGAHTHYSCLVEHLLKDHKTKVTEFNIASFSWRNINTPSFLLLKVTANDHAVNKCYLPHENTVIKIYFFGFGLLFLWTFWPLISAVIFSIVSRFNPVLSKRK